MKLFSSKIESSLNTLLQQEKFAKEIWYERGLNPSNKKLCYNLQIQLNNTIKAVLELSLLFSEIDVINCLKTNLATFDQFELDTEEKELVADYFSEISKLIAIDINKELDIWIYGFETNLLIERKISHPINSLSTFCKNCSTVLTLEIYKERVNIQPAWLIVQCDNCNEFNLLEIPKNVDRYKIGKYFVFESLKQSEYPLKMALEKMEYYKKINTE